MKETRSALLSPCGQYRYWLKRRWGTGQPLVWVMLNPSTADAEKDDATIRRVRNFTKREGYPGFVVVNIYAFRATYPKDLRKAPDPVGPNNLEHVSQQVADRRVVVAWGNNWYPLPSAYKIAEAVVYCARSVYCLGRTKQKQPCHPVRLSKDTPLELWTRI